MVFNSLIFVVFFAVVLALHNLPFKWRTKKINLLVASYVFYAAWNPPFVVLLWLTTVVDFFVARKIAYTNHQTKKRMFLMVSLACNLGLLGFFKYGTFLLQNFTALARLFGFEFHSAAPDIVLPVGISFYTFVTLSYTIDVYKGEIALCDSFLDFALLVTFFPHLVAGPILRAANFLPQLSLPRTANLQQFSWGMALFVTGLLEKVVFADGFLAPVADTVFNSADRAGTLSAWAGTLAFSGQIFFDFDGYSLCAIGVALCLGFIFPDNFRSPYAAIGFSDFWQRWHISLSSWLRDYLYISLGGNRRGKLRTYVNLLLTMLIGGLWHGASWLFVIWGGLHGLYLVGERLLKRVFGNLRLLSTTAAKVALALLTYFCVCLAWIFFRARSLDSALHILRAMFFPTSNHLALTGSDIAPVILITAGLLVVHWRMRNSCMEEVTLRLPRWCAPLILAIFLITLALVSSDDRAFIYFQF